MGFILPDGLARSGPGRTRPEASTGGSGQLLAHVREVDVNDTEQYDNGVKVVPAYLLKPVIVTKENAAEAYANNPTLLDIVKAAQ